jgi:hypothetical protein
MSRRRSPSQVNLTINVASTADLQKVIGEIHTCVHRYGAGTSISISVNGQPSSDPAQTPADPQQGMSERQRKKAEREARKAAEADPGSGAEDLL